MDKKDIVDHPALAVSEDDVRRLLSGALGEDVGLGDSQPHDLVERDRTPSLGLNDCARWQRTASPEKACSPPPSGATGGGADDAFARDKRPDFPSISPKQRGVPPSKFSPLALAIAERAAEQKESKFGAVIAARRPRAKTADADLDSPRFSEARDADRSPSSSNDGLERPLLQPSRPTTPAWSATSATSPGPSHGIRRMSSIDHFRGWLSRGQTGTTDASNGGDRSPRTVLNKQTAEMCDAVQRFNRLSTELANERTLLAWVRTCLAAIRTVFTYLVLHVMTSSEHWSLFATEVAMASLIVISAVTGATRYYQLKSVINMAELPMGFGRISMRPMTIVVILASISTAAGVVSQQWIK